MYGDLTPRGSGVIDLSSHGLDAVPDDVFTKEDTKVLNLGDNHLASLPSELGTGLPYPFERCWGKGGRRELKILPINRPNLRRCAQRINYPGRE